jgi:hypothetical protein
MARDDRRHPNVPQDQVGVLIPLLLVWGGGVIVLWAILGASASDDAQLLLDPAAAAGMPWFTGLISNLGILAWTLGAVAAAAAAHIAHLGSRDRAATFLRHAAIVGGLMTFDDLFQLHSSVFPKVFGIPKAAVLFVYGMGIAAWALTHAIEIVRTRWGLLFAAGVAMSLSIAVDQISTGQDWALLAEDGAKFLGVLSWAAYFTLTARDIASSVIADLGGPPGRTDDDAVPTPRPVREIEPTTV